MLVEIILETSVCDYRILILRWLVLTESSYNCPAAGESECFSSLNLPIKHTIFNDAVLNSSYYNTIY